MSVYRFATTVTRYMCIHIWKNIYGTNLYRGNKREPDTHARAQARMHRQRAEERETGRQTERERDTETTADTGREKQKVTDRYCRLIGEMTCTR